MIISDALGISSTVCNLDGNTLLVNTSGGWKITALPQYVFEESEVDNLVW